MKNKRLVWILVMVILVVNSLVVTAALKNPFSGISGRIGGTLGKVGGGIGLLVIGVNAAIIALLLYLLITIFKFIDLKSNTGKSVFLIVLVLFSIYLAVNLSVSPDGKYQFIWSKPVVSELMRYLFNGDPAKGSIGILRPNRILIFAGATLIFSWFFIGFLKIGQGKNDKFDYALAMLIAAEATRAGMSKGMLIFVGQIIALFMLYTQFKKEQGRHWIVAMVWAYVLQSLVVSGLFKPEDRIWASWFLTIIRIPHSVTGLIWFIIGLVVILPILVVGGLHVSKAEGAAKFMKEGKSFIWNGIKNWARHTNNIFGKALNILQLRDDKPQYPFHRLRLELNVLMNYLLRLQVYVSKSKFVEEVQNFVQNEIDTQFEYTFSIGQQKSDYIEYSAGYKFEQLADSTWVKTKRIIEFISASGALSAKVAGQCGTKNRHILICEYMNILKKLLEDMAKGDFNISQIADPDMFANTYRKQMNKIFEELAIEKGGTYGAAKSSLVRYGLSQYKDSLRWAMLDMNNKNGWYKHPYKFASIDARPWIITAKIERKNGKIQIKEEISKERRIGGPIGPKKPKEFKMGEQEVYMWEVDNKGRFIDDINKISIEKEDLDGPIGNKTTVKYRKVDAEDIYQCDELKEIASLMTSSEWRFFKDDFITGYLHPESRTWRDYEEAHDRKDWAYRELKRISKPQLGGDAAFDREALKDPGDFQYRGRKFYYDQNEEELKAVPPINNYPCVSLLGVSDYVIDLVKKTLKEEEQIKFFQMYPEFDLKTERFRELGEEKTKK